MTSSGKAPDSATSTDIERTVTGVDARADRLVATPATISLFAIRAFGGEMREAFAQACAHQRESLQEAEDRLSVLSGQLASARELEAALALKTQITACLADAAAANVQIWADLVQQVRAGCARLN